MHANQQKHILTIVIVAILATLLALLLWLFTATIAYSTPGILYVAPAGAFGSASPCYRTVQAAVDAAQPGDEIRVAAGTYTGVNNLGGLSQMVYVDKSLTIRGGFTPANWNTPNPDANVTELNAMTLGGWCR